jgi:hypothetical protein
MSGVSDWAVCTWTLVSRSHFGTGRGPATQVTGTIPAKAKRSRRQHGGISLWPRVRARQARAAIARARPRRVGPAAASTAADGGAPPFQAPPKL